MALYRNIAGVNGSGAVGLSLLAPTYAQFTPAVVDLSPTSAEDFRDLLDTKLQTSADIQAQIWAAKNDKYDYLLNHSFDQVTNEGYYVTTDNGSIFKWTDKAAGNSIAYLGIADIQDIENARGTAGALLLHMQQPALAKDTAGFVGGGSSSTGATIKYSNPIQEVQDLPPVTTDSTGEVVLEYTGPSIYNSTPTTTTTTTPTTTTTTPAAAVKSNLAPLVALGGLVAVALGGDALTGRRTNILFAGGVGALLYFMAKRNK